jgi:hypothetical protein
MSDRHNSLPFGRGETWYGGDDIDLNDLGGANVEGQEKEVENVQWDSPEGVKADRDARFVRVRCVRNFSGVTLYGKRLVTLDPSNGRRITGYADTTSERCVALDEFLGTSGVRHGDLCWVVVEGPAIVALPLSGLGVIAVGDPLSAVTTSGASTVAGTTATAGRIGAAALGAPTDAASTKLFLQSLGFIAFAMSAATTNNTGNDMLVDLRAF